MFGRRFYHESMRKVVVAFGTIFNNIIIHRTDSDGSVIQRVKVPLSYSPKEKFLTRLEQQPNLNQREMAVSLPRMGFEISGISYDASRKLQRVGKFKKTHATDAGQQYYQYNPVPYNISFNLYSRQVVNNPDPITISEPTIIIKSILSEKIVTPIIDPNTN